MGDWVCGNPLCNADNGGGRVVCRMPRCRVRGPPARTPQALCLWMRCMRRRWIWAARIIQRRWFRRARLRRGAVGVPAAAGTRLAHPAPRRRRRVPP
eukprot:6416606-Heterocapsa_arctica.AAC.1